MYFATCFCMLFLVWCCPVTTGGVASLKKGPQNTTAVEGETAVLDCVLHGLGPIEFVYWYRHENDETISLFGAITTDIVDKQERYTILGNRLNSNFSLQMTSLRLTDSGTYSCGMTDSTLTSHHHLATATLTVLPNYELGNRSSAPICTFSRSYASNTQVQPNVGDLVYLACLPPTDEDTDSELTPNLVWYKELQDNVTHLTDHSVFGKVLKAEDNGAIFTCKLRYPALGSLGLTIGAECSVMPLRIPPSSWIEPTGEVLVLKNSDAVWTCNGSGIPKVIEYNWKLHPELPEDRYAIQEDGQVLRIRNVRPDDDSTNVTCEVRTVSGLTGEASALLRVSQTEESSTDTNTTSNDSDQDAPSTTTLVSVVAPTIVAVSVIVVSFVIILRCIRKKRRQNIRISSASKGVTRKERASNVASSSDHDTEPNLAVKKPSPLPPRLAHYDHPSPRVGQSNRNYTDLDSSTKNEYVDLSGKSRYKRADYMAPDAMTETHDADDNVDEYETFEIPV